MMNGLVLEEPAALDLAVLLAAEYVAHCSDVHAIGAIEQRREQAEGRVEVRRRRPAPPRSRRR